MVVPRSVSSMGILSGRVFEVVDHCGAYIAYLSLSMIVCVFEPVCIGQAASWFVHIIISLDTYREDISFFDAAAQQMNCHAPHHPHEAYAFAFLQALRPA